MAQRKKKDNDSTSRAHAPDTTWHMLFLETLEETANITTACRVVKVNRTTAYTHKKDFPDFAEAWENALQSAVDEVEEVLWNVAKEGNVQALTAVLKAHRHIYREKPPEVNVNNNNFVLPDGNDPNELLMQRLADMRERMIESGVIETPVEAEARILEESNAQDSD